MDERPTHLDLFSGIGGFALAAQWAGFRTVGFCEIEPFAQRVLAKNFGAYVADSAELLGDGGGADPEPGEGQFPEPRERGSACRIWPDIRELRGADIGCNVTLLTGGFPCQPFSCAGKRRGTADDRHLWPEMLRVIAEARPAWVLGENVAGIINMELDAVLSDLEGLGYACRPFVIPACGVDARHRRNRVWIVAHSELRGSQIGRPENDGGVGGSDGARPQAGDLCAATEESGANVSDARSGRRRAWQHDVSGRPQPDATRSSENASDSDRAGCGEQRGRVSVQPEQSSIECGSRWLPEPDVGRVAHGIPARVDRLRGLGNAIVPQVACEILCAIKAQIVSEFAP